MTEDVCGVRLPHEATRKLDREVRKRKLRGRSTLIREIILEHYAAQDAAPKP